MADPQNYGDEPNCVELIFPQKYKFMGLDEQDFIRLRTKSEIKDIFQSVGIDYKLGKFEAVFRRAQLIQNDEQVSVKAFLQAV